MNNISALFFKQFASQLKNPIMLVQAVIFVALAVVIGFLANDPGIADCENCIPIYVCAEHYEAHALMQRPQPSTTGLFAVIFTGLALMGSSSILVNEDKTTQNFRFMAMANVKPWQYMLGTYASTFILAICVLFLFAMAGLYFGLDLLWFMAVGTSGMMVSILLGITIGMSKYPVIATPLSMMLGLGPMLSMFNETLARILRFTYIQQVNLAFSELQEDLTGNLMIIGINFIVILLGFLWVTRKGKLESLII